MSLRKVKEHPLRWTQAWRALRMGKVVINEVGKTYWLVKTENLLRDKIEWDR